MINPRMRVFAISGSLALMASLALTPAAMAQEDDPIAPMTAVLAAFTEGRFEDAAEPFCAEAEADALGGIGMIAELGDLGMGYELDLLFGALAIDTSGLDISIAEQSADSATLDVTGAIAVGFDEDGLVALLMGMMSTEETPLDEDVVRSMIPAMRPQLESMVGGSVEVSEQVEVVVEDGRWQVCDDLSSLGDALAAAMGAPGDEGTPTDDEAPDDGDGDDPTAEPAG